MRDENGEGLRRMAKRTKPVELKWPCSHLVDCEGKGDGRLRAY